MSDYTRCPHCTALVYIDDVFCTSCHLQVLYLGQTKPRKIPDPHDDSVYWNAYRELMESTDTETDTETDKETQDA